MRYLKNNLLIIIYMFPDKKFKLYNNLEFFVKSNTEDLNYLQNIKYCYNNKLLINSNKSIDDINRLSNALHLSIGLYSDIIYEMRNELDYIDANIINTYFNNYNLNLSIIKKLEVQYDTLIKICTEFENE